MNQEVRALEYAACALVNILDLLIRTEIGTSVLEVGRGVHISTLGGPGLGTNPFVTIYPVGWPKGSSIFARFCHGPNGWKLIGSGEINADHLPQYLGRLRFQSTDTGLGVHFEPVGDTQTYYVELARTQLLNSLNDVVTK